MFYSQILAYIRDIAIVCPEFCHKCQIVWSNLEFTNLLRNSVYQKAKRVAKIGPLSLWVQNFIFKIICYVKLLTENVVSMVSSTPFFIKGRKRGKERNFSYVVVFEFHLGSGVVSLLVSYTVPHILKYSMKYINKQVTLKMVTF